jgi:septal ring factor EnvC (AmiA/AmiB activator)
MILQRPVFLSSAAAVLAAAALLPAAPGAMRAETFPPRDLRLAQTGPSSAEALKQRDKQLEALREEQRKAAETERKLSLEIETIGADRRRLNQAMIDTAARVRAGEANVAATEARLHPLEARETELRRTLESKRAVMAEVLAALQRIGRRPPPAVLVRPEDALQSLRTAMLLGAVLPEMRDRAQAIAANIADLVKVREGVTAARAEVERDLAGLTAERERLGRLIGERQKKQAEAEKALGEEKQRAADLARKAESLKDLIASLERNLDGATRAARAGEDKTPADARTGLAVLSDPGRLVPAVAFGSARGRLPLPVNGVKIRDFGSADGLGGQEKGLSIATRAGAQVTSPCDGWVVYAAPYRNYGQLLILNAGGGYHVLLAGMDKISVDLGQFVLTGEPVAIMGSNSHVAATIAVGSSQPVLYVEFRKDGTPVDPSPWWAASEGEKVRG